LVVYRAVTLKASSLTRFVSAPPAAMGQVQCRRANHRHMGAGQRFTQLSTPLAPFLQQAINFLHQMNVVHMDSKPTHMPCCLQCLWSPACGGGGGKGEGACHSCCCCVTVVHSASHSCNGCWLLHRRTYELMSTARHHLLARSQVAQHSAHICGLGQAGRLRILQNQARQRPVLRVARRHM